MPKKHKPETPEVPSPTKKPEIFPPEKTPELIPSKDPREPTSPIENPIPVPEENPFLIPPEISILKDFIAGKSLQYNI
jgi:hypothetical protein